MKYCPNCGSQNLETVGINSDGGIDKCLSCKMQFSVRVTRKPSQRTSDVAPKGGK